MASGDSQKGFTYLAVMFIIASISVAATGAVVVWHTAEQREKERELLFIGDEFRRAILLYYEKSPGTLKRYPRTLNDLLKDDRQLGTQRYLRRIYIDPMTRKAEWGTVAAPDGGVMGVYSLSESRPIKTSNFSSNYASFEGKQRYVDWQFIYSPGGS